jgi:hypothetical protein
MVGLNTGLISNQVAPLCSVKPSGLGREGARHGIEDHLVFKHISMADIALMPFRQLSERPPVSDRSAFAFAAAPALPMPFLLSFPWSLQ